MKFTDKQFNDILKINKTFARVTIIVFIIAVIGIFVGVGVLTVAGKTLCGSLTLFGTMAGVMAYNPLSNKLKTRMVRKTLGLKNGQLVYRVVFSKLSVQGIDISDYGVIDRDDKVFFDSLFVDQPSALTVLSQYKNTLYEEVKRYLGRDNDWSDGEKVELIAYYRAFISSVLGCDATINNLMIDSFVLYMAKKVEEKKLEESSVENSKKVLNEYFE